jgi:hypothetical protein
LDAGTSQPISSGSSQCIDGFQFWLRGTSSCTGGVQECCAGLLNLGGDCWAQIIDAAASISNETIQAT